jgi:hypothetical protein
MTQAPDNPSIFHITHVNNLAGILREGGLWCDAQRSARQIGSTNIGHLHIKQRRMARTLTTEFGGKLGDYVPFNFCSRSVMLYPISRGHDDYRGGQEQIVHLVSDVQTAVAVGRPWAFTDQHADLAHALHYADLALLGEVSWRVMELTYWQEVREERQAEFLVHTFFPWAAVREIGVMTTEAAEQVEAAISQSTH